MYTMKQACKKAGMTYETLKFYCNEGLVPNVKRDKNNYRLFDDADMDPEPYLSEEMRYEHP